METHPEEDHQKMEKRWGKVTLKEKTVLYMEMKTGELSLRNPEVDEEWEMYKSETSEKVEYYCEQNGERSGPRDTTKSKEKEMKEKETMIIKERQQGEQEKGVEVGKSHPHLTSGNREGIKRDRGETCKNKSEYLLWTLRFDSDDWLLGGKWEDFYLLEEVVNIPPLREM